MMLLALAACQKTPPQPVEATTPVTIRVASINDFHGALYETTRRDDPTRALGGLPWLAAAVSSIRDEHPELLLLDGGDLFQGAWPVNAGHGMGSVDAFNLLGVDAAAIGNHEFDHGPGAQDADTVGLRGALREAAARADFAWLSANILDANGEPWAPPGIQPWTIIERSGVRIGVIGLTTTDTPQTTLRAHVTDLGFTDPVEAVRAGRTALEAAGAEVFIAVGHLTGACEPPDYTTPQVPCHPDGEVGRLLTELPPGTLDVLVAGHAHTLMAHRAGDTFVLESRAKGHLLNQLDLVVGPDGVDADASTLLDPWLLEHAAVDPGCTGAPFPTEPLEVGGRLLTPSTDAIALVARLEAEAGSLCDEVGCSERALGRYRARESAVGNVVADAMLAAMDADLALTNSGGLRADLPAGPLRREHVQAVMPFDNRLQVLELTGTQLREMFRIGASGAHGILQLAGGTYHFDPAREDGVDHDGDGRVAEWERDRLCTATVAGAPLDPAGRYRVVTTDFLVGGGDHFGPVFEGVEVLQEGMLLRDVIADHIRGLETCLGDAALPDEASPRIRVGPCDVH